MTLATVNVTGTVQDGNEVPVVGAKIVAQLTTNLTDGTILYAAPDPISTTTASDGTWSLAVIPNDSTLTPSGSAWSFTIFNGSTIVLSAVVKVLVADGPSVALLSLTQLAATPPLDTLYVSSIIAGTGVTINQATGAVTINATGGGSNTSGYVVDNVQSSPYNATGNGVTDDTAAINAAIAAINAAGSGILFFPAGTYKITSALTAITAPCQIVGTTSSIQGDGLPSTLSFAAGLVGLVYSGNSSGSKVSNLRLLSADTANGHGAANSDHGINIPQHGCIVERIEISGFGGDGIHVDTTSSGNSIGSKYDTVRVQYCNGNGIFLNGQNSSVSTLIGCDVTNVGLWGYNMQAPGTTLINCETAIASQGPGRTVTDAATTLNSNVLTSATANFTSADLGCVIEVPGLPAHISGIIAINSSTSVDLSQVATATATGQTATVRVGGALLDTTLGNGYLNFYAEVGVGSNCAFNAPSTQTWWIGGGWTSANIVSANSAPELLFAGTNLSVPILNVQYLEVPGAAITFKFPGATGNIQVQPTSNNGNISFNSGSAAATISQNVAAAALQISPIQQPIATPAYSTSITPSGRDGGPWQTITATNGTAFTINAPSNPPNSSWTSELTIEVYNNSGGALGAITWDPAYVFAGATWTNPASTKRRFARFEWNGAHWICTAIAAADY